MRAKQVNEAKIQPDRELFNFFKNVLVGVRESGTNDPFHDINEMMEGENVLLVDFADHLSKIAESERRMLANAALIPELGIRIMGFDPPSGEIFIAVDETFDDKFLRMPVPQLREMIDRLWSGFGHETIHRNQISKMGVQQNPVFADETDYFKNKQEVMAMAFSFVEEMRRFHSDDEIMNLMRTGDAPTPPVPPGMPRGMRPPPGMQPMHHPLYKKFKEIGGDTFKLFMKYVYLYFQQDED